MPSVTDLLDRKRVRDEVRSCRNCSLVDGCNGPVPFSGPNPTKIAIVGEAPGEHEDNQQTPFVGPAGKLLRGYLRHNGLDDGAVAFINAVSCFPKRTPTGREVKACAGNLADQLAVTNPQIILIVGGVALGAMGVEGRITDWRGNWFTIHQPQVRKEVFGLATWHPSAVLRNELLAEEFRVDVENLAIVAAGEAPWGNYWCVKCGKYTTLRIDASGQLARLGMPLCGKCYATKKGVAGGGQKRDGRLSAGKTKPPVTESMI